MANILAIDTALSACSVALSNKGLVSALLEPTPRKHIQLVLPMIDELLSNSGLSISDVDAIAFNQGPGSFTGLRIGMGVVQGLAFGADLQVVPVSTLQTIAQGAISRALVDAAQLVMPMIDARMNEVYWGVYQNIDGLAQSLGDDRLNIPEDIVYDLPEVIAVGAGDGWQFRARVSVQPVMIDEQVSSDAEQVLTLAIDALERGQSIPIEQVEPRYLRNKTTWTKRQRLRKQSP